MVNFGPADTVPEQFRGRNLYVHNPTVTLMRTTPEECAELGRRIAAKLNAATGPTALFVPLSGVSMIAVDGQPFHDPAADDALFGALREHLDPAVELHELDTDVNDPEFALAMANRLHELYGAWRRPMTRKEALERLRAQVAAGQADHRRRRRHRALREVRRGRRRRPDHHLQLGPLPDGRAAARSPGMMPYGDANAIVVEMAAEVLPDRAGDARAGRASAAPIRSGSCPCSCGSSRRSASAASRTFPTVGLIDGVFRQNLEETGMGYRARGRDDPAGARARPAHLPVRVRRRPGAGDGARRAPTCSSRTWG